MNLLLSYVKPFKPKLDHNTFWISERTDLFFLRSLTKARTSEKWLNMLSFHASRIYIAMYFLSLISLSVKPGPIGVMLTPGPFQTFANSANSLEFTDFERLIETPNDFIKL